MKVLHSGFGSSASNVSGSLAEPSDRNRILKISKFRASALDAKLVDTRLGGGVDLGLQVENLGFGVSSCVAAASDLKQRLQT